MSNAHNVITKKKIAALKLNKEKLRILQTAELKTIAAMGTTSGKSLDGCYEENNPTTE